MTQYPVAPDFVAPSGPIVRPSPPLPGQPMSLAGTKFVSPPEVYQPISQPRALGRLSRPGLNPLSVAVDGVGNTYVVSGFSIQKFSEGGVLLTEWGGPGSGDGQFGAFDSDADGAGAMRWSFTAFAAFAALGCGESRSRFASGERRRASKRGR